MLYVFCIIVIITCLICITIIYIFLILFDDPTVRMLISDDFREVKKIFKKYYTILVCVFTVKQVKLKLLKTSLEYK